VLEEIREQIPASGFCSSWTSTVNRCEHTRKHAHQLGIDLILPSDSPHLHPIEQVWAYFKWMMAPIVVENEEEFKNLVAEIFKK